MGIFQACVYLLGPKTNFGQSEQNPGFWLIILLASKKEGARLLWENPIKDAKFSSHNATLKDSDGNIILDEEGNPKLYHARDLKKNDTHMWTRFFMSYLVNGVGFHILVHALPIQVAAQSSFTGVVFRAVGMLYLVDLDDTKGFKLIITPRDQEEEEEEAESKADTEQDDDPQKHDDTTKNDDVEQVLHSPMKIDATGAVSPIKAEDDENASQIEQEAALAAKAEDIIEEAELRLQDLLKNGPSTGSSLRQRKNSSRIPSSSRLGSRKNMSVMGFGCMPTNGAGSTRNVDDEKKKNSAQAAILQASASTGEGGVQVDAGDAM